MNYKYKKNPASAGLNSFEKIRKSYLIPNFVLTAGIKSVPLATIKEEASNTYK